MTEPDSEPEAKDPTERHAGRYGDVALEDGTVVVYDRERERRWLKSDRAVALEEAR